MVALALDYRRHVHRQIGYAVLGILLLLGAGYLGYDVYERRSSALPAPSAYTYKVAESVDTNVNYFQNSFYADGPGTNTAYVMDLTNTIDGVFRYSFSASEEQKITYVYDISAVVRGTYAFTNNSDDGDSNVWSQKFQLVRPVYKTITASQFAISPNVEAPYAEYKQMLDELKNGLALPITGDVTVTFSIRVTGDIGGAELDDSRSSSFTAPIGSQIYAVTTKYDKEDTKQVVPIATREGIDKWVQYELYGAIGLGVLALASFVYGLRKKIFKTPYQRELDKIYRYHEGIIVRAGRGADLSGKRVVPVKSFDDMLNLEEELKLPIIAASVSATATQFMIIRDDVVYVYTLGKLPAARHGRSLEEIAEAVKSDTEEAQFDPQEEQPIEPLQPQIEHFPRTSHSQKRPRKIQ